MSLSQVLASFDGKNSIPASQILSSTFESTTAVFRLNTTTPGTRNLRVYLASHGLAMVSFLRIGLHICVLVHMCTHVLMFTCMQVRLHILDILLFKVSLWRVCRPKHRMYSGLVSCELCVCMRVHPKCTKRYIHTTYIHTYIHTYIYTYTHTYTGRQSQHHGDTPSASKHRQHLPTQRSHGRQPNNQHGPDRVSPITHTDRLPIHRDHADTSDFPQLNIDQCDSGSDRVHSTPRAIVRGTLMLAFLCADSHACAQDAVIIAQRRHDDADGDLSASWRLLVVEFHV